MPSFIHSLLPLHIRSEAGTHFSMLKGVTASGKVRLRAMLHGTPSSSMPMLGSPVMTVRAEKSTRLPIRLPRMRPSLPLSRWLMDLMGLEEGAGGAGRRRPHRHGHECGEEAPYTLRLRKPRLNL